MNVGASSAEVLPPGLTAVGVPVWSHQDGPLPAVRREGVAERLGVPEGLDAAWCTRHGFTGKVGQTLTLPASGAGSASATEPGSGRSGDEAPDAEVTLVGVGSSSLLSGDRGLESLRRASAAFVRAAGQGGAALFLLPQAADLDLEGAANAVADESGQLILR